MVRNTVGIFLVAISVAPLTALAADPSALVEDISSSRDDLQIMDFLEPGRSIALAGDETLVLGYPESCRRETIIGGKVTIGIRESKVSGGTLSAEAADCSGTAIAAVSGAEAGATVFRKGSDGRELPKAERVLGVVSPLVHVSGGDILKIERIDKREPSRQIVLEGGAADLEKARIRLARGGTYRLEAGAKSLIVDVDRKATRDGGTALERLLRF